MKNLVDARTGEPLAVGDTVKSLERGDLHVIEDIGECHALGCLHVTIRPVSEPFTVLAHEDEELEAPAMSRFWKYGD